MRRRLLVLAVLVAAAALVGALALWRWADDPVPTVGGPVVEAGACPSVSADERERYELPTPRPGHPDEIPDGAVRVWACQGPGSPLDFPRDALTTHVDDLGSLVNDLPTRPDNADIACAADGGAGYRLRFQYDDGTVADAVGELYGCGTVQVGSTLHDGGREWPAMTEFVRLLREQRDDTVPPRLALEPTCAVDEETGYTTVSPAGRADEMTAAVLCEGIGGGAGTVPQRSAVIRADDLADLLADHATSRSEQPPTGRECRAGRNLAIVGLTAWGDQVLMAGYCGVFTDVSARPAEDTVDFWRPGPEARAVLDRLLGTPSG